MIRLLNPYGGSTWVHEDRLDEYLERGFAIPSPPTKMPQPAKQPAARKKSTTKK